MAGTGVETANASERISGVDGLTGPKALVSDEMDFCIFSRSAITSVEIEN